MTFNVDIAASTDEGIKNSNMHISSYLRYIENFDYYKMIFLVNASFIQLQIRWAIALYLMSIWNVLL